jgi:hypothetical protein
VRHTAPELFAETLARLAPHDHATRHVQPFKEGLYACTEMFVDGFLHLYRAGILKREVDGAVLHGGFFLGPRDFYRALREMPDAERAKFAMTAIDFTNALYGDEVAKRTARGHARFANTALMATLLGDVVSDQLEDGRLVSGVGGQYDFVAQAFALGPEARSILTLNAVRDTGGQAESNIRWSYGHATIPRHLRDMVVTEYGVADLRGKTDAQTITAMLGVADARFARRLMLKAKRAGKLAADAELSADVRANRPEMIEARLTPVREAGLAPPFPLASDLNDEELALLPALGRLRAAQHSPAVLAELVLKGRSADPARFTAPLTRLGLARAANLGETMTRLALLGALSAQAS